MLVEAGEKVHVVVRRTFETDLRRHFIGEIREVSGSVARVDGFFMVFDKNKNAFVRKPGLRVTVMDLSSSAYWVNIIPKNVKIGDMKYTHDSDRGLTISDGDAYSLDISEFGVLR